jgi:rod shape-determining protein MreC
VKVFWRSVFTYFLLVVFVAFLINRLFFYSSSAMEQTASYVVYPFIKSYEYLAAPFERWHLYKKSLKELQEYALWLQDQQDQLQEQVIELQAQHALYADIVELQEFRQRYDVSQAVLARVMLKNFSFHEQVMFVNAGLHKNVQIDMIAVYHNSLIGRVVEVYPWYCKVLLVTDPLNKIAAQCDESRIQGIFEGVQVNLAHLNHVQDYKLPHVGELVLSTGQGMIYPQGFCLGKITHVLQGDLVSEISIEPLVDIHTIEYVYLIAQQ